MTAGEQCCDLCVDGVFKEFFVMAARKSPHTKGSFENCAITCQHNFKLNAREQILSLKAFTVAHPTIPSVESAISPHRLKIRRFSS